MVPEPPDGLPTYVVNNVQDLDAAELTALRQYVDALLGQEDDSLGPEDIDDPDAEVVEQTEKGCIVTKMQECGKDACNSCPHGPYKWRVTREEGDQSWEYIGPASGGEA